MLTPFSVQTTQTVVNLVTSTSVKTTKSVTTTKTSKSATSKSATTKSATTKSATTKSTKLATKTTKSVKATPGAKGKAVVGMKIGKPTSNSPSGQGLTAQQLQAQQAAYNQQVANACQFGQDQTKRSFLVSLTNTCAGIPTLADASVNPGLEAAQKMHVNIVQKSATVGKSYKINGWFGYTVEFANATECVDYFLNDAKGFQACIADELVKGQVYIPVAPKGKDKMRALGPPVANDSNPAGQWLTDYTTQANIPGAPTIVMTPSSFSKKTPWNLDLIDQRQPTAVNGKFSYPSIAGKDVDIYVVDTGIDPNQIDIKGRVTWGVNTADGIDRDLNGHGTEIATNVAGTYVGVAKKANLIAVKVLTGIDQPGDVSDLVAGLEWIAARVQTNGRKSRSVVKYVASR